MVVLAASICTRGGKALLCRQFRDLSKDTITLLLANFPSLISESSGQHTTVEDDSVRYVYQPLEDFYVVLITNKASNILQDLDTLQLFVATISNVLRAVDEQEVFDNAFEIIQAVDEIVTLGYKDNASLSQIQAFLKMDSHEEKIQEIIERNKELEATEERKRRAKEIRRKELANRAAERYSERSGFGGADYGAGPTSSPAFLATYQPLPVIESGLYGAPKASITKPSFAKGGLQLGAKLSRGSSAPAKEAHQPLLTEAAPIFHSQKAAEVGRSYDTASPAPSPAPKIENKGILITINEKISASLTRDGSILLSEVKGDLQLRINNESLARSKLVLTTADKSSGIQYKTHPNVDRALFGLESVIGLKDKTRAFPAKDEDLGVLRWRVLGKPDDTSLVPLLVTAWVNVNDQGIAEVTLEYELTADFIDTHAESSVSTIDNMKITVPIVTTDVNLNTESNDGVSYDTSDEGVTFTVDSISTDEPHGSFEFTIPATDEDALFPIDLRFDVRNYSVAQTDTSYGKVLVQQVLSTEDDSELPFEMHSTLVTESFQVA